MSERVGLRFTTGEMFPADDPVSRWLTVCCMALNDLLLVNRCLLPNLANDGPDYINAYLGRLGAAHLYEASKFLHDSEHLPEVRAFLHGLDDDAQAAYERVKDVGPDGTRPLASQLKRARNHFFHYPELVPQAPDFEKLKQAMDEHRESIGEIHDRRPPIEGFRARFADDIAIELSFPEESVDLHEYISALRDATLDYVGFARAAINQYGAQTPVAHYEWIEEDSVEASDDDDDGKLVSDDG